jgi:hypothetical protein
MSEKESSATPILGKTYRPIFKWILIVSMFGISVFMIYIVYIYPHMSIGPEQPIPFSHRLHVQEKKIDCKYCHSYVDQSSYPGMPPVSLCISCHKYIIPDHPNIRVLHNYYNSGQAIPWVRVFFQPDFVFFNHKPHIKLGVECRTCHGNIEQMDRVTRTFPVKMGFCITCHRQNNVSVECYICHH